MNHFNDIGVETTGTAVGIFLYVRYSNVCYSGGATACDGKA